MIKQYLNNYVTDVQKICFDFLTNIEEHNIKDVVHLGENHSVILDDLMAHQDFNSNYPNDLVCIDVTNPFYKQQPFYLFIQVGWLDTTLILNVEFGYNNQSIRCQFPITKEADLTVVKLARNICKLAKKVQMKQVAKGYNNDA